ncbi:hypothetical protein ACFLTR_04610, partial [Chloroflexota bacterium]
TQIDIIGEELRRLKFKVKLPQEQLRQRFPALEIVGAEKACSGCLIPLLSSLLLLGERGANLDKPLRICLGKEPEVAEDMECLLVGDCAQVKGSKKLNWVKGCPPGREELLSSLVRG